LDAQKIKQLTFSADGTFKIMQMSDFQDYINSTNKTIVNQKSVALMGAALDAEKPDLVVMTGDMLGGNMNADNLQEYIRQMVAPMEERGIPWMITYGNHDEDATTALNDGWNKIRQLAYYRSFAYNVNRATMSGAQDYEPNGRNTYGVGDMYQLIYDAAGTTPLYNVWAFDSNRYDVSGKGIGGYDWIRPQQIQWYSKASAALEAKYGKKIPSLMFYHIPTPEWGLMWANRSKFNVVGEKNEAECPANVNSGLFTAVLERGDVKGMFVGHDHVNDYVGNYYGVMLGYDANVGYQTYGLGGANNDRMRGVRVFELDQTDLSTFKTKMVYAGELGL
ncbi:MAG: metallophosphoesterase family protein, partial [Gracilibacteraceae bacterium]|nr:metallophosphoesterase family protein [Gracilibacteraceae bacterium]